MGSGVISRLPSLPDLSETLKSNCKFNQKTYMKYIINTYKTLPNMPKNLKLPDTFTKQVNNINKRVQYLKNFAQDEMIKNISFSTISDYYEVDPKQVSYLEIVKREYKINNSGPTVMKDAPTNKLVINDNTIIQMLLSEKFVLWKPEISWRMKMNEVFNILISFHKTNKKTNETFLELRIGSKWIGPSLNDLIKDSHWFHDVYYILDGNKEEKDFYIESRKYPNLNQFINIKKIWNNNIKNTYNIPFLTETKVFINSMVNTILNDIISTIIKPNDTDIINNILTDIINTIEKIYTFVPNEIEEDSYIELYKYLLLNDSNLYHEYTEDNKLLSYKKVTDEILNNYNINVFDREYSNFYKMIYYLWEMHLSELKLQEEKKKELNDLLENEFIQNKELFKAQNINCHEIIMNINDILSMEMFQIKKKIDIFYNLDKFRLEEINTMRKEDKNI